jgi:hypothetical protein
VYYHCTIKSTTCLKITSDETLRWSRTLIHSLYCSSLYPVMVFGNLFIILNTFSDSHLHMRIHFFSYLSLVRTSVSSLPQSQRSLWTSKFTAIKLIYYVDFPTVMFFKVISVYMYDMILTTQGNDLFACSWHLLHLIIQNTATCVVLVLLYFWLAFFISNHRICTTIYLLQGYKILFF